MKRAVLLLIACIATTTQAGAVSLRIAAEPEAMLPGLVPSLRISVTNDGSSAVEIPVRAALQVIPPRGEPFVAYATMRGDARTIELAAKLPLLLAPGETRDLSLWSGDQWLGADPRFRTTGAFHLQLVADSDLDSNELSGLSRVVDHPGLTRPLVSNETTFTVLDPAGADLAIWNVIKTQTTTCTAEVTALIWRDYPGSRYAAYCVRDDNDADVLKQIAGYEAALAKAPHPYWADGYRLNLAQFWISLASGLTDQDVDAAVDAYGRARAILEPLARNAVSPEHRDEAARLLELRVQTREQVIEHYMAARGFDDRPVRFYVSCFEKLPGGARKVWFGYSNPNSKVVEIPIGNDNKFTPAPFDRKQPTVFKPGIFDFAFNISTKEPVLVWHLRDKTAQFKLPGSMECPEGFDPNDPSTWQVDDE